jgi:hypothetical protein
MPHPTTDTHRGLTIRQPWAFAIAEGFKTVENRSRRTNYQGPLLIHAGLKADSAVSIVRYSRDAAMRLDEVGGPLNYWEARSYLPSRIVAPPHATLALGAVIATATLAGCHEAVDGCCAPWGLPGCWHWELADVRPLRTAVARAGALTLWKADADLLAAVSAAVPRINTPDVVTVDADGHKHTTIKVKRCCNGCGQYLGDADNRDVDERGNLTDVRGECAHCRPLVELEAQGCTTWEVTPRSISRVDDEVDRLGVYAKGYFEWDETARKTVVVGLRVGSGETRVVARFGDWLIHHPDGHFTVHAAPAAVETGE